MNELDFENIDTEGLALHKVNHEGTTYHDSVEGLVSFGLSVDAILPTIKAESLKTVKAQHAVALETLTGDTTPAERDTWPPKVAFAHSFLAGTATDAEKAGAEQALLPGETLQGYCEVVAAKEAAFFNLSMFAEGFKRKTNAAIEAVDTIEALELTVSTAAKEMAAAIEAFKAQLAA